jgi:hypothetical protein
MKGVLPSLVDVLRKELNGAVSRDLSSLVFQPKELIAVIISQYLFHHFICKILYKDGFASIFKFETQP